MTVASAVGRTPTSLVPCYASHGDYAAHFDALRAAPASQAIAEHLLTHVEAPLDAPARLALFRALWAVWGQLDSAARDRVSLLLDRRFASVIGWLHNPFDHAASLRSLAEAHLAPCALRNPAFVLALYSHHGLGEVLSRPADAPPALCWPRLRAEIDLAVSDGLRAERVEVLQAVCLTLAERDPELVAGCLGSLFEIAVLARDDGAALATLIECVNLGLHAALPPAAVLRWLEGPDRDLPFALAPALQSIWWQPARLHEAGYRAQLRASLRRDGPQGRLAALDAALVGMPCRPEAEPAATEAWIVLAALDRCYADPLPVREARALTARGQLANAAAAALHHRIGIAAAPHGAPAVMAWAAARRLTNHRGAALKLQEWLLSEATEAVLRAAAAAFGPHVDSDALWFTERWQDEEPFWEALCLCDVARVAGAARAMLAMLYTDGRLVPTEEAKCQRLDRAHALWQTLLADPAWQPLAEQQLRSPAFTLLHRLHSTAGGRSHLWVETPGAQSVMIVFSCVYSHETFASVPSLVQGLRGHHLLFVNNPELNWYSGTAFDQVCRVIELRVARRFARHQVSCYLGSMGGYAALRFALHFGFRAIAFNPQVDLDLWAAYRPKQRALIHAEPARVHLQDVPTKSIGRTPIYYTVGATTPDRTAFSLFIKRVSRCEDTQLIVEKFADWHHAGLIRRITGGRVPEALQAIDRRLAALLSIGREPVHASGFAEVPPSDTARFWTGVAAAAKLKLEIVVRDGRVWVRDSTSCGTLPV